MNRLEQILKERKLKGFSWNKLAKNLPIEGESLRMAFKRESVSKYYLQELERILEISKKEKIKKNTSSKGLFSNNIEKKLDSIERSVLAIEKRIERLENHLQDMKKDISNLVEK